MSAECPGFTTSSDLATPPPVFAGRSSGRKQMSMTRRSFALAAVGGAVLPALPALAKTPAAGAQAAGIYRVKIGTIEVTVLNDGSAALPTKFFSGDPAGISKLMEAAFTPGEMAPTTFNEWLINTGNKLVLVDTGYSTGAGPMAGKLLKALAAAGVDPAAIDAVVITHIHPDHCNGLLTPDKQVAFPNATARECRRVCVLDRG
jgi:hypothetical protein